MSEPLISKCPTCKAPPGRPCMFPDDFMSWLRSTTAGSDAVHPARLAVVRDLPDPSTEESAS